MCGLVVGLWATFRVPLGERTLAGHIDRIAATPEAGDLIGGARSRLAPIMTEASRRVLGEYVEAPTLAATAGPDKVDAVSLRTREPEGMPLDHAAPMFDASRFVPRGLAKSHRRQRNGDAGEGLRAAAGSTEDAPALPGS